MKNLAYIAFVLIASSSFGQTKTIRVENEKVKKESHDKKVEIGFLKETKMLFGDFTVNSFETMSQKSLIKNDLEKLVGTLIRIKETDITGDAIDPMTIDNLGIEKMTREDYIFRVFGDNHECKECSLPPLLQVYKTGRTDCYGIVILSGNQLALPYKGTMLYLDLK